MNRALERGPFSVARRGLYRSGRRLDPLVGSVTMDGDSQWEHDKRILSRLSRQGSNGACTTMLAVRLRWSIHCPPALKDQLDPEWAGRPGRIMSSLHADSRIGEPNECSAWVQ
jgi:hypothetical protein